MKNNFKDLERLELQDNPMPKEEIRSSVLRTLDSFKFMAGIVDFYTEKFSATTNDIITQSTRRFYEYMYQNSYFSLLKITVKPTASGFDQEALLESIRLGLNNRKLVKVLRKDESGLILTLELNRDEAERLFFLVKTGKLQLQDLDQIDYIGYYNSQEIPDDSDFIDFKDLLVRTKERIASLVKAGDIRAALKKLEQRLAPDSDLQPQLQQVRAELYAPAPSSPAVAETMMEITDRLAIHHLRF